MKRIFQFGYRTTAIPGDKHVIDCRVLRNPYNPKMSREWHLDQVRADPQFPQLVMDAFNVLTDNDEVWIGCAYGRHRSVAVAQQVEALLFGDEIPYQVHWQHDRTETTDSKA